MKFVDDCEICDDTYLSHACLPLLNLIRLDDDGDNDDGVLVLACLPLLILQACRYIQKRFTTFPHTYVSQCPLLAEHRSYKYVVLMC